MGVPPTTGQRTQGDGKIPTYPFVACGARAHRIRPTRRLHQLRPSVSAPQQILFLPGASGNDEFWKAVAERLDGSSWLQHHLGWPGFGQTPADPAVRSLDDLVGRVVDRIDRPTALVAQSMGGVVAIRAALAKAPWVTHLVLAGLSGGIDLKRHGARDWRPPREDLRPDDPSHLFAAYDGDLTQALPALQMPTLLLSGDQDPISPVGAGQWLVESLPRATLYVVKGGSHTFCQDKAEEVAPVIGRHLIGGH